MDPSSPSKKVSKSRKVMKAAKKPLAKVGRLVHRGTRSRRRNALHEDEVSISSSSFVDDSQRSLQQRTALLTSNPRQRRRQDTTPRHDLSPFVLESTVHTLERWLRGALVLLLIYFMGVYHPDWGLVLQRMGEYIVVSWCTCVALLAWTALAHKQHTTTTRQATRQMPRLQQQPPLYQNNITDNNILTDDQDEDDELAQQQQQQQEDEQLLLQVDDQVLEDDETEKTSSRHSSNRPPQLSRTTSTTPLPQTHPSLEPFYCINMATGERVSANNYSQPIVLDTDYFQGSMMVLIRTPNVDQPHLDNTTPHSDDHNRATRYFQNKQRRFEFQFQLKLKKVPPPGHKVYFACELDEPVKIGLIQRAFVGAALAFVKATNSSFHYSITGQTPKPNGQYEKPHMAFTIEGTMDRVIATPPGQTPPTLGSLLMEDAAALSKRKKGLTPIQWNTDDIYTMALWTAYVDFLEWKCLNLPGIRPFGLAKVIGPQPMHVTLYVLNGDKHWRSHMDPILSLEICNIQRMRMGPGTKRYLQQQTNISTQDEEDASSSLSGAGMDLTESTSDVLGDDDEEDDEEEDDDDIAQLGEGMYLQSGDSIILKESLQDDDEEEEDANTKESFVINGGGFAVLQSHLPSPSVSIVIEKVSRRRRRKTSNSKLIKSGDTVMIKLKKQTDKKEEVLYLTLHRGWWLKWVATAPTKNGFFTIYTNETEFSESEPGKRWSETQSSFLRLGGSFWLYHKRWPSYQVGVAARESPTYGGRMLGLFKTGPAGTEGLQQPECSDDEETVTVGDKRKTEWLEPLHLCVHVGNDPMSLATPTSPRGEETTDEGEGAAALDSAAPKLLFSNEHAHMDVPAWIEMMNRTERIRQLAYVIRVLPEGLEDEKEEEDEREPTTDGEGSDPSSSTAAEPFFCLRTGRELGQIIRLGLSWREENTPKTRNRTNTWDSSAIKVVSNSPANTKSMQNLKEDAPNEPIAIKKNRSFGSSGNASLDDLMWDSRDDDPPSGGEVGSFDEEEDEPESSNGRRMGRSIVGKIAKGVKTGTTVTGKTVVKGGKKVGKGTLTVGKVAGKVIIAPIYGGIKTTNPPAREPKARKLNTPGAKVSTKRQQRAAKKQERDLQTGMSKTMRKMKRDGSVARLLYPPDVLAGELSAPEQSCRTASYVLSRMSSVPLSSNLSAKFNSVLCGQVETASNQDAWFLRGGSAQLGVVPSKTYAFQGTLVHDCVVARCLWESHWREEWCGIYENCLCFYAPLTNSSCLDLYYVDIQSVRPLDAGSFSPLPGCPLLVLETAWQCHYVAFADEEARDTFQEKINEAMSNKFVDANSEMNDESGRTTLEKELSNARFWQGFQNSLESSLSSGRGKWAKVSSSSKLKHRVVLNCRRMVFDLEPLSADMNLDEKFVEDLLSTALSFSLDSLKNDPEKFIDFLDSTSRLRCVSLQDMDRSSDTAFCFYVNLYHCLLQHALLLSPSGPLNKRSVGHFMRTSCYEIGGDVFSLAELHGCIIRGKMSKAVAPKPPYIEPPRKSQAFTFYALRFRDPRINFVLNTGDISCPPEVPILRPDTLEAQLTEAARDFLREQLIVDTTKRQLTLPKVADIYRNDFEGNEASAARRCLRYCLAFLDDTKINDIRSLLSTFEEDPKAIRYFSSADQYHVLLRMKED